MGVRVRVCQFEFKARTHACRGTPPHTLTFTATPLQPTSTFSFLARCTPTSLFSHPLPHARSTKMKRNRRGRTKTSPPRVIHTGANFVHIRTHTYTHTHTHTHTSLCSTQDQGLIGIKRPRAEGVSAMPSHGPCMLPAPKRHGIMTAHAFSAAQVRPSAPPPLCRPPPQSTHTRTLMMAGVSAKWRTQAKRPTTPGPQGTCCASAQTDSLPKW